MNITACIRWCGIRSWTHSFFISTQTAASRSAELGESLTKLGLTKEKLLSLTFGSSTSVTNQVVLDFMNRNPSCTYQTLSQWLSILFGERCPKEDFLQ